MHTHERICFAFSVVVVALNLLARHTFTTTLTLDCFFLLRDCRCARVLVCYNLHLRLSVCRHVWRPHIGTELPHNSLRSVAIRNNVVQSVDDETFSGLALEKLALDGNQLYVISDSGFRYVRAYSQRTASSMHNQTNVWTAKFHASHTFLNSNMLLAT